MFETLDQKQTRNHDSCIVALPREFALANGFPEKCFASLTWRDGKLESEIVEHIDRDEREVEAFLDDFPNFNQELTQIGD